MERLISENRDELKAELDKTAKQIQESLDLDISQMSARIDNLELKLEEAKRPAAGSVLMSRLLLRGSCSMKEKM